MIVQRSSSAPFTAPSEEQGKSLDKALKIGPGGAGGSNTTQLGQIHESTRQAQSADRPIDLSLINPAYDQYKTELDKGLASDIAALHGTDPSEDEIKRKGKALLGTRNVLDTNLRTEMLRIDGPLYNCDAIERRADRIIDAAPGNGAPDSSRIGILTKAVHRAHVGLIPDVLSSLDHGIKNGHAQLRDKDAVVVYAARWICRSDGGDGKQQLITLYAVLKSAHTKGVAPEILAEVVVRCGNGLHFYHVVDKTEAWMLNEIRKFIGTDSTASKASHVILKYQTEKA